MQLVIVLLALALGGAWVFQAVRRGAFFTSDPSGVTRVTFSRPADGETNVLPNAFVAAYLNSGHAIDPESLDHASITLARAADGKPVPARVNTSAAGDDIVLTPMEMLEPATRYVFDVRNVKDSTGADLMPYRMTFTTAGGAAAGGQSYPVAFEKVEIAGDQEYFTGLTVGPDRKLYAGTVDGKIVRRHILPDGALGPAQVIATVQASNKGPRLITGIAFDPKSTAENLILWVSHGQFILNQHGEPSLVGAEDWTGKISVVSGPELADYRDVVVRLPRSWRDHLNNQLAFGPDGCVYFTQGSHTAVGAPDAKWGGNRVERMLSAAVLRLDPSKVPPGAPVDVKTRDSGDPDGAYDPAAPGAPLTIHATGVRVGYDMLWHSAGHLFTAINGSAPGGNTPGSTEANVIPIKGLGEIQPDLLLRVEKGGYYGHPNPIRREHVLNGGNPTDGKDALEVTSYPVGTRPERHWRPPVYNFGTSVSPNGIIEFQSRGKLFNGLLDGKLLVTRFSGGKDIIVLSVDASGSVTETLTGIAGLTNFTEPLDLTQDPHTGCVYVAEYRGQKLALLRPVTDAKKLAQTPQQVFRQEVPSPR